MKVICMAALMAFQVVAQEPVFEVATIKPSNSDRPGYSIHNELGRMETRNTTLHQLIEYALGVRPFEVTGGPAWINDARFDVNAKNEGPEQALGGPSDVKGNAARVAQIRARLRHLLEERFQLELREEQREVSIYALSVDKGGLKIKAAAEPLGNVNFNKTVAGGTMDLKGGTMSRLCQLLSGLVERPVVDETGLAGAFDAELKYSLDIAGQEVSKETYPSIFTAVKEQLGLRLTGRKGMSPVWVVVRAERPGEN